MWLPCALLGFTLLAIGAVSLIVWQSMHPARFSAEGNPRDEGIAFEDVTFPSRDNLSLSGWWVPARKPVGTIILCHGYPSERHDMFPMIPFLHTANYNILAFDFRRLGKSGGDLSTVGLREPKDLMGAVDYATMRSHAPIAAMGWSMGAATSITAAAQDHRIVAVVADSPYTSLDIQTVRRFGSGPIARLCGAYAVWLGERIVKERLSDASPLKSVRQLAERPLLLIHSRNDSLIPVGDSQKIYSAANEPKEMWVTESSGHVRSYSECTAEYQKRVLRFLAAHLQRTVVR